MILRQPECCTSRPYPSHSKLVVLSLPLRIFLFYMTTAFDVDLEVGHLSGNSLEDATMGASMTTDTTSEHAVEEPYPDDYGFVDVDNYGGPEKGTRTHATRLLVRLKLFPQMRPVQRMFMPNQPMERVSLLVCTVALGRNLSS